MDLNKTWEDCLKMWKWISERWDGSECMSLRLKQKYLMKHHIQGIHNGCFFCDYTMSYEGVLCNHCPGYLVDSSFRCGHSEYHYEKKPKEFYQKLLRLNAIRLQCPRCGGEGRTSCNEPAERDTCSMCNGTGIKEIKDEKSSSDI